MEVNPHVVMSASLFSRGRHSVIRPGESRDDLVQIHTLATSNKVTQSDAVQEKPTTIWLVSGFEELI